MEAKPSISRMQIQNHNESNKKVEGINSIRRRRWENKLKFIHISKRRQYIDKIGKDPRMYR